MSKNFISDIMKTLYVLVSELSRGSVQMVTISFVNE